MMKIIFAKSILKKENINNQEKNLICKAFGKGIFDIIKGENLPSNSELIKIYMTTVLGARRVVFLVDVVTKDGFFLFYRSKNDLIGENISIKNKIFKETLKKYLHLLKFDLENREYELVEF